MGNAYGSWTLFAKETRRFLKVKTQTIFAPVLTAVLYVIVFRYAMGNRSVPGLGIDYFTFLVPGLVIMSMLQNAFANTSSSMISAKMLGVHVYLLMAPLSAFEVVVAFLAAAVVRAAVVGGLLLATMLPFVDISVSHAWMVLLFGLAGSLIMGAAGLIGGLWANKFDDMSLVNNFVILPLTFLSGVFYSIEQLPPLWQRVNSFNPFFYLIDGFRQGFLGIGDTHPATAAWVVLAATAAICWLCWHLWRRGWRIKE